MQSCAANVLEKRTGYLPGALVYSLIVLLNWKEYMEQEHVSERRLYESRYRI